MKRITDSELLELPFGSKIRVIWHNSNHHPKNDEYYGVTKDGFKETTGNGNKMILLEPRAFSESQQIADYLKARNTVVVNLKRVTPEQAKRIIDLSRFEASLIVSLSFA